MPTGRPTPVWSTACTPRSGRASPSPAGWSPPPWTHWPTGHRCCATTPSAHAWSTGSDSATRPTAGSPNCPAPRRCRTPTRIPIPPTRRSGCSCPATPRPASRVRGCRAGPRRPPSPSSPSPGRSSAAGAARRRCRCPGPARALTPSPRPCARPPPTRTSKRWCCGSTAPAGRSTVRRPSGGRCAGSARAVSRWWPRWARSPHPAAITSPCPLMRFSPVRGPSPARSEW